MSKLRILIDGEWWSRDFHTFFRDLEVLARLAETGDLSFELDGEWKHVTGPGSITMLDYPGSGNTETNRRIRIDRIEFASPGFTDLSGAGKVIEQIRLFFEFLITKIIERNDRELDREERRLKLEVLRQQLQAAEPPNLLDPSMLRYLENGKADALIASVAEGRVIGVAEKEKDSE